MSSGKEFISGETADLRIMMAENLKKMREAKGFAQAEMAEIAHVETNTYQRYEYANLNVPMSKIYRLSRALDCTVDELLVSSRLRGVPRPAARPESARVSPSPPPRRSLGGWIRQGVMQTLRRPPRKTSPK